MGEIAIILTGCGRYDGTDVAETVCCAIAVEKLGYTPTFYSFDKHQNAVYDHTTSAVHEDSEARNMLQESWRVATGYPQSIQSLEVENIRGMLIPGGVGIIRNITNLQQHLDDSSQPLKIDEDLQTRIEELHSNKIPLGVISHSALLPAIALQDKNVVVTFGNESGGDKDFFASTASELGATVEEIPLGEVCIDSENNIVSTPGFLSSSSTYIQVHNSIDKLVTELINLNS